ncbi:MAG TPA: tagatose-6-phosphate ketose isomerase, partial [Dyella sp.]
RELSRKQLGMPAKLLVGAAIPADILAPGDVAIELPELSTDGELSSLLAGVVTGQLLAMFKCMHLGDHPDAPSQGVLTRVVQEFAIHGAGA